MLLPIFATLSAAFLLVLILLSLLYRVIARIGLRNALRRKTTSLLIVLGLMIGTALISSSLVIQDTMYYTFRKDAYDRLHETDEAVIAPDVNGTFRFFNYSLYGSVKTGLEQWAGTKVDGVSPLIMVWLPVLDDRSGFAEPRALVIGFDPTIERNFGTERYRFESSTGNKIDGSELAPGEAMLNRRCADELDAVTGDPLTILYGERRLNLTTRFILRNQGLANHNEEPILFVPLDALQEMLGVPGKINYIRISNRGGREEGDEHTPAVQKELESILVEEANRTNGLTVDTVKSDSLDLARNFSEFIGDVFTIMGAFVVLAGLVLIVLIFVMLAQERRTETGISRAVGMKRRALMLSYLLEGGLYSVLAVAAGALAGLGISYVILYFLELRTDMIFYFEWESILLSACLGLVSTLSVIAIASWLVSKINIVRAIRKIPEPLTKGSKRILLPAGILLLLAGAYLSVVGFRRHFDPSVGSDIYLVWGLLVLIGGLSIMLFPYLPPRIVFTAAGAWMVFWSLNPLLVYKGTGPEMFISSGIILVPGGVLVLIFNSGPILRGLNALFSIGRKRKNLPVIRIGISYPLKKRFRTAMIMVIFTLVIFATSVEAVFTHLEMESVARTPAKQTGGYDLVCTMNPLNPVMNITDEIKISPLLDPEDFEEITPLLTARGKAGRRNSEEPLSPFRIMGVDREFAKENGFRFHSMAPGYESREEVWNAVLSNSSLAVTDRSVVKEEWDPFFGPFCIVAGDMVTVAGPGGQFRDLTVIGVLESFMVRDTRGIYVDRTIVARMFGVQNENMYLVDLAGGADSAELSRQLEREFVENGMVAVVMMDNVNRILDSERSIVTLMEGYMAVGLLVGLVGLGIVTVRSVVERKREIGMVRALGFTRRMVIYSFLVENLFVVVISCIMGIAMAIGIGHRVYLKMFAPDVPFLVPWASLAVITAIAIAGTVIASIPPGLKASRIPPAEAVRYMD